MDLDAKKVAEMKEELRRDLEALERVERIMAGKSSLDSRQTSLPLVTSVQDEDDDDGPSSSMRGTIEALVNADTTTRWTNQKILKHLVDTKFPLRAKKPIYSIGQAMQKLADAKKIRLVKKGAGNQPNVYKGRLPVESEPATGQGGGTNEQPIVQ